MRIFNILFGLIFGLLFAGAGTFIAAQTVLPTFGFWYQAADWKVVEGQLTGLKGGDNETLASYSYVVDDIPYENNRVYVTDFKDNIGSYHQDLHAQLAKVQRSGLPLTIWYNPTNPQQSVLDRDMRWGLFALMVTFCSVFIVIGLAVCYASIFGKAKYRRKQLSLSSLRRQWHQKQSQSGYKESFFSFLQSKRDEFLQQERAQAATSEQHQHTPWLANKHWQTPHIRSKAGLGLLVFWVFTVVWIGGSTPILFVFEKEWSSGNFAVLLGLLFPLAGILLLAKTIRMTAEWLRFRDLVLVMDPFPGAIGGHVGGYLELMGEHDANAEYKVELECVYSYVSSSGKNRSRHENVKWAQGGSARIKPTAQGLRLSFRFDVPGDLPEAEVDQSNNYVFWRLKLSADIPGADLDRQYNIPVFKTGKQSTQITHDISAQHEYKREQEALASQSAVQRGEFAKTALGKVMRFERRGNNIRFYFPMMRNKLLGVIAMIFFAGFGGATYAMWTEFGDQGAVSVLVIIFSIPFFFVALFAGISTFYLLFNSLTVEISRGSVRTIRSLFLLPLFKSQFRAQDLVDLQIKRTGSTGQGVKMVEHFKVFGKTKDYKKITLAEGVNGEDLANQLKEFIAQRIK